MVKKDIVKGLQKVGAEGAGSLARVSAAQAADAVRRIYEAFAGYRKVEAQERTKREAIRAAERTAVATIHSNRDIVLAFLDRSFDERKDNFRRLFDSLDTALEHGGLERTAPILDAIVKLAETSPFEAFSSPEGARVVLKDPNTKFEF